MWIGEEGRKTYQEEIGKGMFNFNLTGLFNQRKPIGYTSNNGDDGFSTRTTERTIDYFALVENEQKSILIIFPNTYKGWEKLKQECSYLSEDDVIKLSEYHKTTDGAFYLKTVEEDVFVDEFL